MKFWQELKGRAPTMANTLPLDSFETGQVFRQRKEMGNSRIFQNTFSVSRRIFLIRGYQFFLQVYLFLDNSSN